MYERLSCAVSSCAFACSHRGRCACSYWPGRVVEVLLRQRVLAPRAAWSGRGSPSRRRARPGCLAALRLRRVDLRLERLQVHEEEHLPGLHDRALGVDALVEEAETRAWMLTACELCVCATYIGGDRHVARCDRDDGDFDRPLFGRLGCLAAAARRGRARKTATAMRASEQGMRTIHGDKPGQRRIDSTADARGQASEPRGTAHVLPQTARFVDYGAVPTSGAGYLSKLPPSAR